MGQPAEDLSAAAASPVGAEALTGHPVHQEPQDDSPSNPNDVEDTRRLGTDQTEHEDEETIDPLDESPFDDSRTLQEQLDDAADEDDEDDPR